MIKLRRAVIVEGKYDKIKLSSLLDTVIITTDGFGIYKDKEKTELIRTLASTCGIVILTDSDSAGLKIRNHIKGCCKNGDIINVFVPQIKGKEKRKAVPSSEGYLGVEGLDTEILEAALKKGYANYYNWAFNKDARINVEPLRSDPRFKKLLETYASLFK